MKRIAVVDDSGTARMFVRRCLEAIGFGEAEFFEADNGKPVIDEAKKNRFDLIVTDLTMPEMDGEALLKRIKASPKNTETPVLVITSAGNKAKEEELIKNGALGVLAKPFSPADLYNILQPLME